MTGSIKSAITLWVVLLLSPFLLSCGGGGSSASGSDSSGGTGTLELKLTDAAIGNYQAVYVTIAEVQVHKAAAAADNDSGWQTILTPEKTYNLLELVNGVFATLGIAELAAGRYNQMRLILGDQPDDSLNIFEESHPFANYLVDSGEEYKELKVPSGFQTGIKIVKGFTIIADGATELILDFNAAKSVVQAGKSGKYLLKPTIKVLETVENSVSGVVDDGIEPIAGAVVSAQIYDPDAVDPKDEVTTQTTTVSMDTGAYKFYLPLNTYNIVATMDGYLPACREAEAEWFDENDPVHFSLIAETETITISGIISGLATDEDSALLSIRQLDVNCGGAVNVTIEVASVNVANGAYSILLPPGTYDLVASAEGETTQVFEDINTDADLNIAFGL